MFDNRGDFFVISEPFLKNYKYKRDNYTNKYFMQKNDEILGNILYESLNNDTFVKDMAYHIDQKTSKILIERSVNIFLIRNPVYTVPSLYSMNPKFTLFEVGYHSIYNVFQEAQKIKKNIPVIIDGELLKKNPVSTVEKLASRISIDKRLESLTWNLGSKKEWVEREDWHLNAINSSGFTNFNSNYAKYLSIEKVKNAIQEVTPIYNKLFDYVI
ncbi:hypothetical protein FKG94_06520 [Exilibacterium tricleocarpae]|uniref:Sulfotransferase family protein n=2 Tax=Exilibacterium tricleocarpae TaxID=2591008 RepID=A0A545TYV3_9GAMM|nr:hypothetical protein FKG94_06520 [Exilibacterium tricleocarpae]